MMKSNHSKRLGMMVLVVLLFGTLSAVAGPRVIQITADEDGKFKVPGQKKPMITLKAQEVVVLRITSHKGSDWEKDGAVHSFTINALKDQGWDLRLKEGTKDFTVSAPAEPGEYVVECTVRCGKTHDDMKMKLIVTP
jgi:heme/copper-type cytochrome/quinol oxidase subunit 2